jgi:hypothetical protein
LADRTEPSRETLPQPKVYWPEASRATEGEIIEKARQIARRNDAVNGHLPNLICSHDFDEYVLHGKNPLGFRHFGWRSCTLKPLSPADLFVMPGHYHLWVGSVEHNNISVSNLTHDKLNGIPALDLLTDEV